MKSVVLVCLILTGCAGFSRNCSQVRAQAFGSNWLVAQYKADGTAMRCWKLANVSVANEEHSDGIHWQSSDGHLVHIGGWYSWVQVNGDNFEGAAKMVGVDLKQCE